MSEYFTQTDAVLFLRNLVLLGWVLLCCSNKHLHNLSGLKQERLISCPYQVFCRFGWIFRAAILHVRAQVALFIYVCCQKWRVRSSVEHWRFHTSTWSLLLKVHWPEQVIWLHLTTGGREVQTFLVPQKRGKQDASRTCEWWKIDLDLITLTQSEVLVEPGWKSRTLALKSRTLPSGGGATIRTSKCLWRAWGLKQDWNQHHPHYTSVRRTEMEVVLFRLQRQY